MILTHCLKIVYSNAEPLQKLFWAKKLLRQPVINSLEQPDSGDRPIEHYYYSATGLVYEKRQCVGGQPPLWQNVHTLLPSLHSTQQQCLLLGDQG